MIDYKITDGRKFRKVLNLDTSMLKGGRNPNTGNVTADGTITLQTKEGEKHITGQHGGNDYAAEYGFILTEKTTQP